MKLSDDGHCFVCGPRNPIGLKLDFRFNGKTMQTEFIPGKEFQGYQGIVHGGILSTLLDEVMVKLAIALDIQALTAHMDIRFQKALGVGEKVIVQAEVLKESRKLIESSAQAVNEKGEIIASATGKLIKVNT